MDLLQPMLDKTVCIIEMCKQEHKQVFGQELVLGKDLSVHGEVSTETGEVAGLEDTVLPGTSTTIKPGDQQPGDKQLGDQQPGDKQPGDNQPGDKQPGTENGSKAE